MLWGLHWRNHTIIKYLLQPAVGMLPPRQAGWFFQADSPALPCWKLSGWASREKDLSKQLAAHSSSRRSGTQAALLLPSQLRGGQTERVWAALQGLAGQSLSEDMLVKELTGYAFGRCISLGKRKGNSIRQRTALFRKDVRYPAGVWVSWL